MPRTSVYHSCGSCSIFEAKKGVFCECSAQVYHTHLPDVPSVTGGLLVFSSDFLYPTFDFHLSVAVSSSCLLLPSSCMYPFDFCLLLFLHSSGWLSLIQSLLSTHPIPVSHTTIFISASASYCPAALLIQRCGLQEQRVLMGMQACA